MSQTGGKGEGSYSHAVGRGPGWTKHSAVHTGHVATSENYLAPNVHRGSG